MYKDMYTGPINKYLAQTFHVHSFLAGQPNFGTGDSLVVQAEVSTYSGRQVGFRVFGF